MRNFFKVYLVKDSQFHTIGYFCFQITVYDHHPKICIQSFSENTYVVFNEEKKAVIIDPGMYYEEEEKAVDSFIVSNGLN